MNLRTLLEEAGKAALRAVIPVALVVGLGISSAPDLDGAKAQAVVGIVAIVAAALKAITVFVPQLTVASYVGALGRYVDAFLQAGLAALITGVLGLLAAPDLSFSKALITGVLVGALTAGIRAVQALVTPDESLTA